MKLSDFHYDLPEGLIAQYPLPRGTGRLLVVERSSGRITHCRFSDLGNYLISGDLMVFNNTRVIPARIHGIKTTGGKAEIFLLKQLGKLRWKCLIKASKSPRPGTVIKCGQDVDAVVEERLDDCFTVEFNREPNLEQLAEVPLPPYIRRSPEALDRNTYQTVYAKHAGSVAAPTAGLHFTPETLERLDAAGIEKAYVTLHVGPGTFQPVRTENITEHRMHSEEFTVDEAAAAAVNQAMVDGRRVITVGTTSTRVLEHLMREYGEIRPGTGTTEMFIYPGRSFGCISGLLTNFHLPGSTLLMLVCAFGGYETIMKAYQEAVEREYRFFSYGDAMLII